ADDVAATAWASAPPPHVRVHAVTALGRAARTLTDRGVDVLAGAVQDLAALVSRSTLKLETAHAVVVAWPETLLAGEHAAALDALLGEAKQARRIILSWNPAALRDFLERHAHRAHVEGSPSVDESGRPLPALGPAHRTAPPPCGSAWRRSSLIGAWTPSSRCSIHCSSVMIRQRSRRPCSRSWAEGEGGSAKA